MWIPENLTETPYQGRVVNAQLNSTGAKWDIVHQAVNAPFKSDVIHHNGRLHPKDHVERCTLLGCVYYLIPSRPIAVQHVW